MSPGRASKKKVNLSYCSFFFHEIEGNFGLHRLAVLEKYKGKFMLQ
jgi:hypothetical protein